ncbi:hypothetical protein T4E_1540 [Trichinella pseudospiralis]|uniref:Uncharacterized protein n=1 Tax=Trichinella pseudospiralis TaxID=6337 RepID=A0A0V0Y5X3_TRIPS|nr:hypothetical protein T4E_1540 [Trichinella pseudospiralis]KRY81553.1 hypothetical protein T4D_6669 [Trichinella pseudospiralis]
MKLAGEQKNLFYEEFVLIYDKHGFKAVIWICFVVTTVIRQMDNLNNCTVDHQPRYNMLKTEISKKRNFTEIMTIPTMYNQQQVSG